MLTVSVLVYLRRGCPRFATNIRDGRGVRDQPGRRTEDGGGWVRGRWTYWTWGWGGPRVGYGYGFVGDEGEKRERSGGWLEPRSVERGRKETETRLAECLPSPSPGGTKVTTPASQSQLTASAIRPTRVCQLPGHIARSTFVLIPPRSFLLSIHTRSSYITSVEMN